MDVMASTACKARALSPSSPGSRRITELRSRHPAGRTGKTTHDARLVAAMNVHGISSILTFNVQDFARYAAKSAVHPETLA